MINSREITTLHPTLQRGINEFIKRCNSKGLDVCVTQTLRDIEYQNKIYSQGRTTTGKIVTNARGGNSFHNYGLAFDICKNIKGEEYTDKEFFKQAGAIWIEMGGVWGGNFKSIVDTPHFEFSNGLTIKDLKSGKKLDKSEKMKWEDYMVEKRKFLVNGEEKELNSILFENKNHIELRELEAMGIKVGYDKVKKIPTISNK